MLLFCSKYYKHFIIQYINENSKKAKEKKYINKNYKIKIRIK